MKHTPGPWQASGSSVLTYKAKTIAKAQKSGGFEHKFKNGEPEANARLIAAAPEMLSLLVEFIEAGPNVGHNLEFVQTVMDLVNKTQGQS